MCACPASNHISALCEADGLGKLNLRSPPCSCGFNHVWFIYSPFSVLAIYVTFVFLTEFLFLYFSSLFTSPQKLKQPAAILYIPPGHLLSCAVVAFEDCAAHIAAAGTLRALFSTNGVNPVWGGGAMIGRWTPCHRPVLIKKGGGSLWCQVVFDTLVPIWHVRIVKGPVYVQIGGSAWIMTGCPNPVLFTCPRTALAARACIYK